MITTVGHSTATAAEFSELVRAAAVGTVVDIRRFPGSRKHPQFGREAMRRWLPDHGIGYRWIEGLGGRRRPDASSTNVGLRNPQFRAYGDYMASVEFRQSVDELLELAASSSTAVMCAESVWWRCHRRLLSDHLVLVEGIDVVHLFHDGRLVQHPVTEGARRLGDHVVYDQAA